MLLVTEIIILHQRRVRRIVIDTVASVGKGNLGTCRYLVLLKRKDEIKSGGDYIYLAMLQIVVIEVCARNLRTVRQEGFREKAHIFVPVVTQVIHIPSHFLAFVIPDLIGMKIQIEAVGTGILVTVGVQQRIQYGGRGIVNFRP